MSHNQKNVFWKTIFQNFEKHFLIFFEIVFFENIFENFQKYFLEILKNIFWATLKKYFRGLRKKSRIQFRRRIIVSFDWWWFQWRSDTPRQGSRGFTFYENLVKFFNEVHGSFWSRFKVFETWRLIRLGYLVHNYHHSFPESITQFLFLAASGIGFHRIRS